MASIRRQILAALKGKIDNITVANGYNNTVKLNTLRYVSIGQLPPDKFPAITYFSGQSLYNPLDVQHRYTSGSSADSIDGWEIAVVGYIQTDTDPDLGTDILLAMEDLIEDIITAVLADHTLGIPNVIHNCYLNQVMPVFDYLENNIGVVEVVFNVKYDFLHTAP